MFSMYCLLLIWQLMQRHMLAGTFFSIGLNDQDVRFSLLGNKQTDELEFSVSICTGDSRSWEDSNMKLRQLKNSQECRHLKLWFKGCV